MISPLVFLHGWCCEADHFASQISYFSPGRDVVSVPWQSDLMDHSASVDLSVAEHHIESVCLSQAWTEPVVLIGHSMGGMLAAMIARSNRLDVKGIVVVDATWPLDSASSDFFKSFIPGLEADFGGAIREFFESRLTAPGDDRTINDRIIEKVVESDAEIALALFRDLQTPGRLPRVEEISVPILGISSSLQFLDRDNLLTHSPDAWYGQIPGSGHFLMQQAPDQLNAMLETFLIHIERP